MIFIIGKKLRSLKGSQIKEELVVFTLFMMKYCNFKILIQSGLFMILMRYAYVSYLGSIGWEADLANESFINKFFVVVVSS